MIDCVNIYMIDCVKNYYIFIDGDGARSEADDAEGRTDDAAG